VLAAALVWHGAYAGFTDVTTARALPTISTGTLALTDDDAAIRMFAVTGLKPGDTAAKCIAVSATGSAAATVRLYGTGRSSTNALANWLNVTVSLGTGGSTRNCTGFAAASTAYSGTLAAFPTDSWTGGVGSWTTTGTATTRVYRIVYTFSTSTPTSAQSGTAALGFVWEARTR
jgi:hypothetical protein